jgi:hypothetical protein
MAPTVFDIDVDVNYAGWTDRSRVTHGQSGRKGQVDMGDVAYRSEVRLVRERGPQRTAHLPAGEQVAFGVHGAVAEHYGVNAEDYPATSTTLDYVVAAAAG